MEAICLNNEVEDIPQKLEISFYQGDMVGWILINLNLNEQKYELHASDVFPPFRNIINFFKTFIKNKLPCSVTIDEEGKLTRINAYPIEDPNLFKFLLDDELNPSTIYIKGIIEKRAFVKEFIDNFELFIKSEYNNDLWAKRNEEHMEIVRKKGMNIDIGDEFKDMSFDLRQIDLKN